MNAAEKLARAVGRAERDANYWKDIAVTDFTRELHARMKRFNIKQGELARRLGTSRPYVTKLLSGSNFTLHTMAKLAMALDTVVRIRLEGMDARTAERRNAEAASSSGETVVIMARYLAGLQKVTTSMDSSEPVVVSGVR